MTTIQLLQKTKAAWPALSAAPEEVKNRLLLAMADALESHIPAILDANGQHMADAQGHISAVMLDRLRLDEGRIRAMADGVRAAAIATAAGCEMVIANGSKPEVLYDIAEGRPVGTRFLTGRAVI